jgi:release factor glutamine methyltransferase
MTEPADIATLLARATTALSASGIDGAGREARLLLQYISAIPVSTQIAFGERLLEAASIDAFEAILARRCRREPLSHILGYREFWSLRFQVTADTLDPRADSETLVEAVLGELRQCDSTPTDASLSLLDFGTGSGCLLLALLSELPQARGLGIDLNPGAVLVAAANAQQLGLAQRTQIKKGNWDEGVEDTFDIVISNPPYIPSEDLHSLQPEVAQFEPSLALDGGRDGLEAYRKLANAVMRVMKPSGFAAFEIGAGQGPDVVAIMRASGLRHVASKHDLQAFERVLLFRKD